VNALYVAAEFAAVSVRRSRIQQLAADGNPLAAWLLPVLESPEALDRYIGASQIGITLSSLVLGAYAQQTFAVWLTPYFAELGGLQQSRRSPLNGGRAAHVDDRAGRLRRAVPKLVALQYPTQTSLYTFLPMLASLWIYRPFIKFLNGSALLVLRVMGTPYQAHRHIHSPDEIELSSPRAATADCSSPTSIAACSARCG
jgi:CBS domain containing-hemolysin-like protein